MQTTTVKFETLGKSEIAVGMRFKLDSDPTYEGDKNKLFTITGITKSVFGLVIEYEGGTIFESLCTFQV